MPSIDDAPSKQTTRKETDFTRWLSAVLEREKSENTGVDLAEIGRRIGSDYNYLWRVSVGLRTPSLEKVVAIGRAVGDPLGALRAYDPVFAAGLLRDVESATVPGMKRLEIPMTAFGRIEIMVPEGATDAQLNRLLMAVSLAAGTGGDG